MLSVAHDRPVDPLTLAILRRVDSLVQELGIDYFVAGAIARDILMTGVFGLDTGRATRDVDLAVAVEGWAQFEAIKSRLIDTGQFAPAGKPAQRLYYRLQADTKGYPLDIIPFGGVEQASGTIAWPPDHAEVLNVAGFRDVLGSAIKVEIEPGFAVPVASLPGLAILKLFAWIDRGNEDPKDALDLAILLRKYADAGNDGRLYREEIGILEAVEYDVSLAGARLLGKDVGKITAPATRDRILALLDDAKSSDRLVTDMAKALRAGEDPIATAEGFLQQFKAGLQEG